MEKDAAITPRAHVCFIQSSDYFRALEHLPVHPRRLLMTLALLNGLSRKRSPDEDPSHCFGMQFISPTPATVDQLLSFHTQAYIDILCSTRNDHDVTDRLQTMEEFGLVDDAYVFPGLYEYCCYVAGATITACDTLRHLMSVSDEGSVPVVINLGGGRHHAMRSEASGFCYVNDVVLGIQRLLRPKPKIANIDRVLCIDIDVHHGDGIQEAFYFSHRVTTISFHLFEPTYFPGTGDIVEIGMGPGKYHNVNLPLQRGITDSQYVALFNDVMDAAVGSIDPQVLVLVCGVDTLARDELGGFNLTSKGITDCVTKLRSFNIPLLLLGGGGYSGIDACKCLATVVATIAKPEINVLHDDVPDHEFYEQYGPDFRMTTKEVIHKTNKNTSESLEVIKQKAICTLNQALCSRKKCKRANKGQKRKMT